MRKYIYIIALSIAGLVHVGCSKFDEMNRDPYAIYDAPAVLNKTDGSFSGTTGADGITT